MNRTSIGASGGRRSRRFPPKYIFIPPCPCVVMTPYYLFSPLVVLYFGRGLFTITVIALALEELPVFLIQESRCGKVHVLSHIQLQVGG
jgi:hypothetical protein